MGVETAALQNSSYLSFVVNRSRNIVVGCISYSVVQRDFDSRETMIVAASVRVLSKQCVCERTRRKEEVDWEKADAREIGPQGPSGEVRCESTKHNLLCLVRDAAQLLRDQLEQP